MSEHSIECRGCAEYEELSRRGFMGVAGGAAIAAMTLPAWLPRVALAKDYRSSQRDVIISVFLRGAADGLTICAPFTEPNYATLRPNLALTPYDSGQANHTLQLTSGATVAGPNGSTTFGLAQGMAGVMPAYDAGHLLIVHAAGSTDPSRSHFDAQRFMEVGKAQDVSITTGWLGRHLLNTAPADPNALLRALSISTALPKALVGGPLTLPIPNLDSFGLLGNSGTTATRFAAINDMYTAYADPLHTVALNTLATINLLNTINFAGYVPAGGAAYPTNVSGSPTNGFALAMKTTAALIKAQVGVEAVAIDLGGWDTHTNQGVNTGGAMFNLMTGLSNTLGAFHTDMTTGGTSPRFVVVVMSEFGRRAAEVGAPNTGTDHGHGNAMLIMGNCIAGRRVLTQWPGLNNNQLYQGLDLQVTTDYRDILAEIAVNRLGNSDLPSLFPGYTPTFRGVTVAC